MKKREVITRGGLTWKGPIYPGAKETPTELAEALWCNKIGAVITVEPEHVVLTIRPGGKKTFRTREHAMDAAMKLAIDFAKDRLSKLRGLAVKCSNADGSDLRGHSGATSSTNEEA